MKYFHDKLEAAGEMVRVRVVIVNVMSGTLEYGHGTLTGPLISTMIAGEGLLEGIEEAFAAGIEAGMDVSRTGDTLILLSRREHLFLCGPTDSAQQ
ncbi:hypothetical protein TcBrA4_0136050 [Trypanosoma cruzi]|nr:hypothetical protein TcBrA4_0136050 [Trypanosoma cruzi]